MDSKCKLGEVDELALLGGDLSALSWRALLKWIRNPAAVLPGFFTALFYIALFGNSFNPTSLVPSNINGFQLSPSQLDQVRTAILSQTFGGAATYISYLTGWPCLCWVYTHSPKEISVRSEYRLISDLFHRVE